MDHIRGIVENSSGFFVSSFVNWLSNKKSISVGGVTVSEVFFGIRADCVSENNWGKVDFREFTSIKRFLGFRRSIFMGGFFGLRFSLNLRLFISSSNQLLSLGFLNSFFVERRNQFVFGV